MALRNDGIRLNHSLTDETSQCQLLPITRVQSALYQLDYWTVVNLIVTVANMVATL